MAFLLYLKKDLVVYKLVEDLGFLEVIQGSKGYMKTEHPDLTIEFLVPERGRVSVYFFK